MSSSKRVLNNKTCFHHYCFWTWPKNKSVKLEARETIPSRAKQTNMVPDKDRPRSAVNACEKTIMVLFYWKTGFADRDRVDNGTIKLIRYNINRVINIERERRRVFWQIREKRKECLEQGIAHALFLPLHVFFSLSFCLFTFGQGWMRFSWSFGLKGEQNPLPP